MIVYHVTDKENVESIMSLGLIPGFRESIWTPFAESYDEKYGYRPIYVCEEMGYGCGDHSILAIEVDVDDLEPDYPSQEDDDTDGCWTIKGPVSPDRIRIIRHL